MVARESMSIICTVADIEKKEAAEGGGSSTCCAPNRDKLSPYPHIERPLLGFLGSATMDVGGGEGVMCKYKPVICLCIPTPTKVEAEMRFGKDRRR